MAAELGNKEKRAWVAYYVSHVRIVKEIDRRLTEAGCVTLDIYGILLALEDAPGRWLIMSDLSEVSTLSKSGVTRIADRMEKDGLIQRQVCPGDRRKVHAVLTDKGLAERERAWEIYRQAIAELFAPHMNEAEADTIQRVLSRVSVGLKEKERSPLTSTCED